MDLPSHFFLYSMHCTENLKQIFPEKELRAATVPISNCMCVCERFIYSHDQSAYSAAGNSLFLYSIHCTENSKQIFPAKELREDTVPQIHVSVREFAWSICLFCCRKVTFSLHSALHCAKNLKQIFPEKEWRAATVSIIKFMCVCERFIYSHDRSAYSAAGKSLFLVQYTLQRKLEITNIPS
jgi:hypothetical protein